VTNFNTKVSSGSNDAAWGPGGTPSWDATTSNQMIGSSGGNGYGRVDRFTGVTVPQGATITSATIGFVGNAMPGTVTLLPKLEDADNPSFPTSNSDANGRTKTSGSSQTVTVGLTGYTTFDITAAVQAVVNRGGWSSGNAMQVFTADNGSSGNVYCYHYDGSPSNAAQLTIDYTDGSVTVVATPAAIDLGELPPAVVPGSTHAATPAAIDLAEPPAATIGGTAIGTTPAAIDLGNAPAASVFALEVRGTPAAIDLGVFPTDYTVAAALLTTPFAIDLASPAGVGVGGAVLIADPLALAIELSPFGFVLGLGVRQAPIAIDMALLPSATAVETIGKPVPAHLSIENPPWLGVGSSRVDSFPAALAAGTPPASVIPGILEHAIPAVVELAAASQVAIVTWLQQAPAAFSIDSQASPSGGATVAAAPAALGLFGDCEPTAGTRISPPPAAIGVGGLAWPSIATWLQQAPAGLSIDSQASTSGGATVAAVPAAHGLVADGEPMAGTMISPSPAAIGFGGWAWPSISTWLQSSPAPLVIDGQAVAALGWIVSAQPAAIAISSPPPATSVGSQLTPPPAAVELAQFTSQVHATAFLRTSPATVAIGSPPASANVSAWLMSQPAAVALISDSRAVGGAVYFASPIANSLDSLPSRVGSIVIATPEMVFEIDSRPLRYRLESERLWLTLPSAALRYRLYP